MAVIEGCRHSLEIAIPVEEVEGETSRITADVQKRARLPGFRPGKAPATLIRKQFGGDIRQKVLESPQATAQIPQAIRNRLMILRALQWVAGGGS